MKLQKIVYGALAHKKQRKYEQGLTLIELIIVVVFLGILSAVALPNIIGQSGKARDIEFVNSIGLILRAQQAYHWEKGSFVQGATDMESLELLNVTINTKYIDSFNIVSSSTESVLTPVNNDFGLDNTRGHSGGIFYDSLDYQVIICRSPLISSQILPPTNSNDCAGNNRIK